MFLVLRIIVGHCGFSVQKFEWDGASGGGGSGWGGVGGGVLFKSLSSSSSSSSLNNLLLHLQLALVTLLLCEHPRSREKEMLFSPANTTTSIAIR